jgi:transposase
MKVSVWAEIRRLHEIEKLSARAIASRLPCSRHTVRKALGVSAPLRQTSPQARDTVLGPHRPRIEALIAKYPELSAVRVLEEIAQGPDGYRGSVYPIRRYLRRIRPARGRVYQEVHYEPGEAMQVDWGECGSVPVGQTRRRVSVFVAVLCYSRMIYIEFTLAQRKAEFYRALVNALTFCAGSPRKVIFDNLKAAVLSGSGRHARLHPEFMALCGHYCMEPIPCERRDPESKGVVEGGVRYVKRNALQGRSFACFEDYVHFAPHWRDGIANVRIHATTQQRPVDRFANERGKLRPLPLIPFDTDEVVAAVATPHARVHFDGNRYSVPPEVVRRPVTLRADGHELRVLYEGAEVARHTRCYDQRQLLVLPDHQLAAIQMRRRRRVRQRQHEFDALGPAARRFHLELLQAPVRPGTHLRRLLALVRLYGRTEVLAAIDRALEYQTYDAAYVESIVLQECRRRQLPAALPPRPQRQDLIEDIDLEEPDPGRYDQLFDSSPGDSDDPR